MMEYKEKLKQNSRKLIAITTVASLIITILEFCGPLVIKDFIDHFETRKLGVSLLVIAGVYFINYIVKIGLSRFVGWYELKFKNREMLQLFRIMFSMKYEELIELEPTYLVEKINTSVNTLFSLYSETVSNFCVATATIIVSIVLMLKINVGIAGIFFMLIPIQIVGYKKLNQKLSELCMHLQTVCAKSFSKILSITSEVDYIKGRKNYENLLNLLKPAVETINAENAKVGKYARNVSTTLGDLINVLNNVVYIYSAVMMLLGKITLSDFIFISLISALYFPALSKIVNTNLNIRDLKGVYDFIENEMLNKCEEDGITPLETSITEIDIKVEAFGIRDKVLIDNGKIRFEKGDVVFFTGESGSGKSSLMKGILKFIGIHSVKINGIELSNITNSTLRKRVSYYSQNIPLINGTIRENVLMGAENTKELEERIYGISFLKKFVEMPEGLDTVVLENGANLSGGDKQKIALARIFIEDVDVIILDEVTSSIDKAMSNEIISEIIKYAKEAIIIILSHDTSLQCFCNKKMILRDKRIVEVLSVDEEKPENE